MKGLKGEDMKSEQYRLSQINDEIICIVDRYLKSVIKHTVIRYEMKNNRFKKKGIMFMSLENEESTISNDEDYHEALDYHVIETEMGNIKVTNETFADLLLQLPVLQREVLIQNIIFDIPIEQFAAKHSICTRTAERYKHHAKDFIKKGMKKY